MSRSKSWLAAAATLTIAFAIYFGDRAAAEVTAPAAAKVCDGTLTDKLRRRTLPLRVRLPESSGTGPIPVILFSHGLGGSTEGGTAWGEAWAKAGFAVIHLQHPGSDKSVWESEPTPELRRAALQKVNFPKELLARFADVKFAAAAVGDAKMVGDCSLATLDKDRIGGAGHSFGAHTMMVAAGQKFDMMGMSRSFPIPEIKAFIVLSPSAPQNDPSKSAQAYGGIKRPVMAITGTRDAQPFAGEVSPLTRTSVYTGMPEGGKVLLLFDDADHITFNGGQLLRAREANDDRVWPLIQTLTTEFFKAKLLGDTAAEAALAPAKVQPMIGTKDVYESK
jgi:dienelactone hydrolase